MGTASAMCFHVVRAVSPCRRATALAMHESRYEREPVRAEEATAGA
jgi:hypothetical protein